MPRKPLTTEQIGQMVGFLAAGTSQVNTAKALGCSQATVSKYANKEEIREMVQRYAEEILEKAGKSIVHNTINTIRLAEQRIAEARATGNAEALVPIMPLLQLADKKEERVGRMVGLFPSHSPSLAIQSIYKVDKQLVVHPRVLDVIGPYIQDLISGPTDEDVEGED